MRARERKEIMPPSALGKRAQCAVEIGMGESAALRVEPRLTCLPDIADTPSKRTRRQTRSALLNDENIDPETIAIRDDGDGCDTPTPQEITEEAFPGTPSRRARRVNDGKQGAYPLEPYRTSSNCCARLQAGYPKHASLPGCPFPCSCHSTSSGHVRW